MTSYNVLVVDDELDIRELIQEILTEEGYKVTVASSASEAREARQNEDFDLILLDIWMPDTDGISLLKEWSENNQLNSYIPRPIQMLFLVMMRIGEIQNLTIHMFMTISQKL